ncbi:2Fe-2S iron-sulfur cluster-binding protein [Mycolicibacterium sp.]|uniref:2Fe-2S iron-sulfur cluster-binding protein n=1 Tax=Mycolicibacterium sp. TaxID=2320850 RepID=UPI003D0DCF1E
MTKVTFLAVDADAVSIDVPEGVSVMHAAVENGVAGILADCGGQRQCATCHVYVRSASTAELAPMTDEEDEMLDITACERDPDSRLSCQLVARAGIDELVVELPARQR